MRSVTDLEREDRLWERLPSPLLGWYHPSRGWEVGISGPDKDSERLHAWKHADEGQETVKLHVPFSGLVILSTSKVSKYIISIFK